MPFFRTSTINTSNSNSSLSGLLAEPPSLTSPNINTTIYTTVIREPSPPPHLPPSGLFSFGSSSASYNGEVRTTSKEINSNQIYSSLSWRKPSSTEISCLSTPVPYNTSNNNNMIEPVRATEGFSSSPILFNAPPPLSAPRAPFS
ncbi:unnamed protein product, partial [Rotaria magnacalcarata]